MGLEPTTFCMATRHSKSTFACRHGFGARECERVQLDHAVRGHARGHADAPAERL